MPGGETTAFVTGASGFVGGALARSLIGDGWRVRALARSERSAEAVRALGAEAVAGDLDDVAAIRAGAKGCSLAFHAAAMPSEWGRPEEFERINVQGTRNALAACREAGVARFVGVGTEAACYDGEPLIRIDETATLKPDSPVMYSASKARAELAIRKANADGFETVVLRARLVWGPGDPNILPGFTEAIESGRFTWVDGGRHLTSTTHIDNCVAGLRLAAERGRPGEAYFVTDGSGDLALRGRQVRPSSGFGPRHGAQIQTTVGYGVARGPTGSPLSEGGTTAGGLDCGLPSRGPRSGSPSSRGRRGRSGSPSGA